jgi:membrane protease YdiL (CAAX protease family)
MSKKSYRLIELVFLFVVLPGILYLYRLQLKGLVIPLLILVALLCLVLLLSDRTFSRKLLWKKNDFGRMFKAVVIRFIVGGALLTLVLWISNPAMVFNFPRSNLRIWMMVMILYPVFSVYPQELIYRVFFFHRYRDILTSDVAMIAASGLAFGFMHVILGNWIAVLLSTVGGIMFAYTYSKSRSILLASIEHGLWGDLIFTIGLGMYFYSGAIR